jgi:hypothetical protein
VRRRTARAVSGVLREHQSPRGGDPAERRAGRVDRERRRRHRPGSLAFASRDRGAVPGALRRDVWRDAADRRPLGRAESHLRGERRGLAVDRARVVRAGLPGQGAGVRRIPALLRRRGVAGRREDVGTILAAAGPDPLPRPLSAWAERRASAPRVPSEREPAVRGGWRDL